MAPLEVPADVDEVCIEDDPDEEVAPSKSLTNPSQPTAAELAKHRIDHLPYRSWCKWCVMGRGRGSPHVHHAPSQVPRVGLGYFFITSGGVKRKSELQLPDDAPAEGRLAPPDKKAKSSSASSCDVGVPKPYLRM